MRDRSAGRAGGGGSAGGMEMASRHRSDRCRARAVPGRGCLAPGDPLLPGARWTRTLERALGLFFEPTLHGWVAAGPASPGGTASSTSGCTSRRRSARWYGCGWSARGCSGSPRRVPRHAGDRGRGYLVVPIAPPPGAAAPSRPRAAVRQPRALVHHLQSPYAALPSGHVAFAVVAAGPSARRCARCVAGGIALPARRAWSSSARRNHLWPTRWRESPPPRRVSRSPSWPGRRASGWKTVAAVAPVGAANVGPDSSPAGVGPRARAA